jgi:hypothetical protein
MRAFLGASVAINLLWFVSSLFRAEWWVVALGVIGLYGQGLLLSLQLGAGWRLAGYPSSPRDERKRSTAFTLIALGQPAVAALFGLTAVLRHWGTAGEVVLVTAKTAVLGTLIALALRLWSGRSASGLFLSIVLINVIWPVVPLGLLSAGWANRLPGVFSGRSNGWMNPLLTSLWHVPQCAVAAAWLARSGVDQGGR